MRTIKTALGSGLLCTFLVGCSGPAAKTVGRFDEQEIFKAGEAGYQRYRIPALVVSSKGTILAFAEAHGPRLEVVCPDLPQRAGVPRSGRDQGLRSLAN